MDEKQIKNAFFQMASDLNVGYIVLFHDYVRDKLEDKEQELSEMRRGFSGNRQDQVDLIVEHETFSKVFPKQLSINTFLLLYSHLEEFIYHIWKTYLPDIDLGRNQNGSMSRYKQVFKHLFCGDLSSNNTWELITEAEKLRNCILHANGRIDLSRNPHEIERIIKKHPKLLSSDNNRIIIEDNFIDLFFSRVREIIRKIESF